MSTRPRILCVDDEAYVVEGLRLTLRRDFDVLGALSGAAGLEMLSERGPFAVVVSDMRMPGMDGAEFLSRARQVAPDTVRVVLTGQADLSSSVQAVNKGEVFRFLTKPCPVDRLKEMIESAAAHHAELMTERSCLNDTVRGAVEGFAKMMALASPEVFQHAMRMRRYVLDLADTLQIERKPVLALAAMFSHAGLLKLPKETVDRYYRREALDPREEEMIDSLAGIPQGLLEGITDLQLVAELLDALDRSRTGQLSPASDEQAMALRVLRFAHDLDAMETRTGDEQEALRALARMPGRDDGDLLDAYAEAREVTLPMDGELRLPLEELEPGMVLAHDILTCTGATLADGGSCVSDKLKARLLDLAQAGHVGRTIDVVAPNPHSCP